MGAVDHPSILWDVQVYDAAADCCWIPRDPMLCENDEMVMRLIDLDKCLGIIPCLAIALRQICNVWMGAAV